MIPKVKLGTTEDRKNENQTERQVSQSNTIFKREEHPYSKVSPCTLFSSCIGQKWILGKYMNTHTYVCTYIFFLVTDILIV